MGDKKLFIIIILILFILLLVVYFIPKRIIRCGTANPPKCKVCVCQTGVPFAWPSIGGVNETYCLLGGTPKCVMVLASEINQ